MASWLRGLSTAHAGNASPAAATASVAATVAASIKDSALSRRAPRVARWSREAAALPRRMQHGRPSRRHASSIRPRRPSVQARGAIRAHAGASPRPLQDALASRKRHLGVVNLHGCRANAGFPPAVRSPGLSALLPTTAAQGGYKGDRENSTWHQGGTSAVSLSALSLLRFSAVSRAVTTYSRDRSRLAPFPMTAS